MWDGGWHGWFLGPIMMLAFLALATVVIVLIVRWLGGTGQAAGGPSSAAPDKTPVDILKERFARGEIDQEDFDARRRALGD